MIQQNINNLRHFSYKLFRELEMLESDKNSDSKASQHLHILVEISQNPKITISQLAQILALHISTISRIVSQLLEDKLIKYSAKSDRREKHLELSKKGENQIKKIDKLSESRILNAFRFLGLKDQEQIIAAIKKYSKALEKSRLKNEVVKIKVFTIPTAKPLRCKVSKMIKNIWQNELKTLFPSKDDILNIEKDFYYNNSYNFWYAANEDGEVVGSIALKKINRYEGQIKNFFVAKEYREQEVAQSLILKLLRAAKNHKITNLYLGGSTILEGAQRFYTKLGFKKIDKKSLPSHYNQCLVENVFYVSKTDDLLNKIAEKYKS